MSSSRSFTVFQDAPVVSASLDVFQDKVIKPAPMQTRSSARRMTDVGNAAPEIFDKENVNPLTGERVKNPLSGATKRKTSVLATKVQPSLAASASKARTSGTSDSGSEPEKKKRKATAPMGSGCKRKAKSNSTTTISAKKTTSKSKRSSSKRPVLALPRVPEEEEQIQINSHCYELTVKPLADVSEAYYDHDVGGKDALAFEEAPFDPEAKFAIVKAASVEPEIRDYIEDPSAILVPPKTRTPAPPLRLEDMPEATIFSTPERKKIYAAFTFSSPSTSSSMKESADFFHLGGLTPHLSPETDLGP